MTAASWAFPGSLLMSRLCKHLIQVLMTPYSSNSLMKFKLNMYKLKEGREMKADVFSKLVATTLYERR